MNRFQDCLWCVGIASIIIGTGGSLALFAWFTADTKSQLIQPGLARAFFALGCVTVMAIGFAMIVLGAKVMVYTFTMHAEQRCFQSAQSKEQQP